MKRVSAAPNLVGLTFPSKGMSIIIAALRALLFRHNGCCDTPECKLRTMGSHW